MLGFFGVFGRSQALRRFDQALREVGVHPRLVPEAVKLASLKLLGDAGIDGSAPRPFRDAAELLGYCMLGAEDFTESNDATLTQTVEARLEAAVAAGDSLDARLALLALHAGVIQPSVIERYGLEAE